MLLDWASLFGKRQDASYIYDADFFNDDDLSQQAYIKRIALETCINFIARNFSQAEFKHVKNYKRLNDTVDYKLNVRPNRNQNATEFWRCFLHKLIFENEALVIQTDTNDLVVADSFIDNESALYPDTFTSVTVRGYTFQRSFSADDVIYCRYSNKRLERFTDALFADYGKIFGRMIDIQMRNNQIRAAVKANLTTGTQKDKASKLQGYLDKVFNAFKKKDVAIVPVTNGFEYEELGGTKSNTQQSIDQLIKLKDDAIDTVADILGIPANLLHGQQADSSQLEKQFNQDTLQFFYDLVGRELNSKLLTQNNYQAGERIVVAGKNQKDIFSLSDQIDKLVSSGAFNRNEIRIKLGEEPKPGLDDFVITKNYTATNKGDS